MATETPGEYTRWSKLDDFGLRAQKRGTAASPNTVAQTLAVVGALPLTGVGVGGWNLNLYVECVTDTAVSFAHYVGARSRVSSPINTVTRYNVTSGATMLPTPTVVIDAAAGTITVSLAAATVADGNVAYVVRFEYRTVNAFGPDAGSLPTIT